MNSNFNNKNIKRDPRLFLASRKVKFLITILCTANCNADNILFITATIVRGFAKDYNRVFVEIYFIFRHHRHSSLNSLLLADVKTLHISISKIIHLRYFYRNRNDVVYILLRLVLQDSQDHDTLEP